MALFHEEDGQLNLPKTEERVLEFWKRIQAFEKSVAARKGKRRFVFYEGPPYANGRPGIHHVLVRAFKDIVLRYKTMQGFYVPRRAGWDTHGLPTEIEVEKQLGIKQKKEIEKLGIGVFNQKARESVWKYKEEWERLTERIGYWLDIKDAYVTYTNEYIETLWWIIKQAWKRGFLGENLKIVPYCPRCGTTLANHELGMPGVYRLTKDPSVYIKFPLVKSSSSNVKGGREYLLVWTTTPWTLPANLYVAVNPALTYTKYRVGEEFLWSYNLPPEKDGAHPEPVERLSGEKLVGLHYEPLYKVPHLDIPRAAYEVVGSDIVSAEDGTGLLHVAPSFGEEDFELVAKRWNGRMVGIPITVDDEGKMVHGFPGAGKYVKEADEDVKADLTKRGLLYLANIIEHEYPFCWRCDSALVYMARRSWFFEVSRLRKELVENNKTVNWTPAHLKEGRFGEWIKEARDWALSRSRYWGAPLPIWRCEKCDKVELVGSGEELAKRAGASRNHYWTMRHGEAENNTENIIDAGQRTSHLTARGKKQAERAAQKLKAMLAKKKMKIDLIIASPIMRTRETAEIVAKTLGLRKTETDKRLLEIYLADLSGCHDSKYHKMFPTYESKFEKGPARGESLRDLRVRTWDFLKATDEAHRGKNILLVSHEYTTWMLHHAGNGWSEAESIREKKKRGNDFVRFAEVEPLTFKTLPRNDAGEVDFHRPFVDSISFSCDSCEGTMKRVEEVADVWFDSGAMPWASEHYPFGRHTPRVTSHMSRIPYPADYICEAIDQTRGWFYTLLAVATLLGRKAPYKNVLSTGLVLDKRGQKMSKSKGNAVSPWDMVEKYGADAVRWYFYTINPPEESKNFDEQELAKAYRRFHLLFYNSYVFYRTYAKRTANFAQPTKNIHLLDKWILARLAEAKTQTTERLDRYDIRGAALALESLVEDLSRWYIRRSRRRLQKPESAKDFEACSSTLGHVLFETVKLVAPFSPFFAESLYEELSSGGKASISVHLTDWPKTAKLSSQDKFLLEGMAEVRRAASVGLAKRAEAGIKVRQPLSGFKVKSAVLQGKKELLAILAEEVNVKKAVADPKLKEDVELDTEITPALKEEGTLRELVRAVQELRQEAKLSPKDTIELFVETPEETLRGIVSRNETFIKKEVGAKNIIEKPAKNFLAESNAPFEGKPLRLALRKV